MTVWERLTPTAAARRRVRGPCEKPGHLDSVSDSLFVILSSPGEAMFKRIAVFFLVVTTAKAM